LYPLSSLLSSFNPLLQFTTSITAQTSALTWRGQGGSILLCKWGHYRQSWKFNPVTDTTELTLICSVSQDMPSLCLDILSAATALTLKLCFPSRHRYETQEIKTGIPSLCLPQ